MLQLLPLRDSATRTVDTQSLNESAQLLSTPFEKSSLDHKHRGAALGRWLNPIPRRARPESEKEYAYNSEGLDSPETSTAREARVATIIDNFRRSSTVGEVQTRQFGPWKLPPDFRMSASFGQALFPLDEAIASGTASVSSRPVFTSSISGLTTLLSSANTRSSSTSGAFRAMSQPHAPSLVYEFMPAPEQNQAGASQVLPNLRIEMRTTATGTEATFHRLYIYVQDHFHTVLLPEQAVDLQLHRFLRLAIRKGHGVDAIDDWVTAVSANIASGERISAPDLTIDIPRWTIAGQPAKGKDVLPIKYLFSSVRYRQSAPGSFQNLPVTYSTNRSGKLGSRGGSLNMYYNGSARDVQAPSDGEDQVASFIEKCLMFAEHITQAASNTQPVAKIEKLRNVESARKMRREEQHAVAAMQGDNTTVDAPALDALVATEESPAASFSTTHDSVATSDTAEIVAEQYQEPVQLKDEVPAPSTESIESQVEGDSAAREHDVSPASYTDDATGSSSEEVELQDDQAKPRHQDPVTKAHT